MDDVQEGTTVCTQCGLVLSDQLFLETRPAPVIAPIEDGVPGMYLERDRVLDWCFNGNIPVIYIMDVLKLYDRHVPASLKTTHTQKDVLLATCLYETLKGQNIGRSLREICAITGQKHSALTQSLKRCFPHSEPLTPSVLVDRFCARLGLTHQESKAIKQYVEAIPQKNSANPGTVLASHVHHFLKVHALRKVPLYKLCQEFGVSTVAVRRYTRRYLEATA